MTSYETFYPEEGGSVYPFENPYKGFQSMGAYHPVVKDIAYPTDPLTANQLKKVSDKISTGARTIEVSGLGLTGGGPMKHLASIPRQHWKEIDRLRKLTGVDLTFHGPLVDSSGFSRGNWSEDQRKEAETQMNAAVELAQQMNSDDKEKGVVMTFHTNNGLPEVKRTVKLPDGTEKVVAFAVANERTGEIGQIPPAFLKKEYLEKEGIEPTPQEWLKEYNKKEWQEPLQNLSISTNRVQGAIIDMLPLRKQIDKKTQQEVGGALELYELSTKDPQQYNAVIKQLESVDPKIAQWMDQFNANITFANANSKNAYIGFKEMFNRAMETANQEDKGKLMDYKKEALPIFQEYKKDEKNIAEFNKQLIKGLNVLESLKNIPQSYIPLEKFAIDKGSETFSNVAIHAYKNAQKYDRAPGIISIENPPAGMSGLTRAAEIKELIEASRNKFIQKATLSTGQGGLGMSKEKATDTAKKIIGATWDVGHINSIRKWGYTKADVLKEAETIAPYVKHMHIADNLGFEDSELPIGMGNVPIDEILNNKQWGENFRKAKKAIETGDWFSRQGGLGMTYTPVRESLSGLTAPVYAMGAAPDAPYWQQSVNNYGGYFGGLGPINPEVHHSIYQAGFSQLPAYLGAEMPGKATNSSFSGAPLE